LHGCNHPPIENDAKARPIAPKPPRLAEVDAGVAFAPTVELPDEPELIDPELEEKKLLRPDEPLRDDRQFCGATCGAALCGGLRGSIFGDGGRQLSPGVNA